jgi:hypothetical protein
MSTPHAARTEPLRFAHPFFTTASPAQRGARLLDYIQGTLQPIPTPRGDSTMTLADIIGTAGATGIERSGRLRFHCTGDTGKGVNTPQGDVAEAMAQDFDIAHPDASPAFFFHLGDVIYGPGKDNAYRTEFYEPYVHYPGKILAIPGNHDGEVFATTDPTTLEAFLANFCAATATVPAIAGTIYRQTMTQPGVYWLLDAPFAHIIGLYSNAAENPGFLSAAIPGPAQAQWLVQTLTRIQQQRPQGTRKALIMATHHPPFTAGGHSPSTEMLAEIDAACQQAQIMPDLFLSGHAHSYQRYTRRVPFNGQTLEIPYLVVGIGGINDQAVPAAHGQVTGDHTFVSSRQGYGYVLIEVTATAITGTMTAVSGTQRTQIEQFSVSLASNRVS